MIVLYHGGGAGVTEVHGNAMREEDWTALRGNAIRLLTARGQTTAVSALERFPFELRDGTNYFQDDFSVLYAVLPLEEYIQLEEFKASAQQAFRVVCDTLREISSQYVRFVVAELETADGPSPVPQPSPQATSEAVEVALSDAEELIRSRGPASALDRVHTALHGYLRVVLDRVDVSYDSGAPITKLFRLLRERHPEFKELGARSDDLWKIVMSTASIVDALNVLRNNASLAHPTDQILGEPEAMLAINAARTLFHYLDAKVED